MSDITAAGSLTAGTVRRAIEKIANAEYTICNGSDHHVVHPVEYERGGLAQCANCFQIVYLGEAK